MRLLLRLTIVLLPILVGAVLLVVVWQSNTLLEHHTQYTLKEGMWPTIEEERTFLQLRHLVLQRSYGEDVPMIDYQQQRDLAFNRAKIIHDMSSNGSLYFSARELRIVNEIYQEITKYKQIDDQVILEQSTASQLIPILDNIVDLSHELLNRRREVTYNQNYSTIAHIQLLITWIIVAIIVIFSGAIVLFAVIRNEAIVKQNLLLSRDRIRIAAELHDIVNYHLSVITQKLDRANKHLTTNPVVARTEIIETRARTRLALDDARASIHELRKGDIQPLAQSINKLAVNGLNLRVAIIGKQQNLPAEVAFAAYRIAQEAIANTLKHAQGATYIAFTLNYKPNCFELIVEDDGKSTGGITHIGMGLTGMQDRVANLKGIFEFGPSSTGYRIYAEIPTENNDGAYSRFDY